MGTFVKNYQRYGPKVGRLKERLTRRRRFRVVWTVKCDSKTLRVNAYFLSTEKKVSVFENTQVPVGKASTFFFVAVCEPDWMEFQASCYRFIPSAQTWYAARKYCAALDARLVVITSEEENEFVARHSNTLTLIGLSDELEEGRWVWENGLNLVYENFDEGEPNNQNDNEDFVEIYSHNGKWNDLSLSYLRPFICEKA